MLCGEIRAALAAMVSTFMWLDKTLPGTSSRPCCDGLVRCSLPAQAMVYRTLLSSFAEACSPGLASGLYTMHLLDPKRELSRQVSSCLAPHAQHAVLTATLHLQATRVLQCRALSHIHRHGCHPSFPGVQYPVAWHAFLACQDQSDVPQVREFSREQGIALVRNLAQVMDCLQKTTANLPPCSEEMEVRTPMCHSASSGTALDAFRHAYKLQLPLLG